MVNGICCKLLDANFFPEAITGTRENARAIISTQELRLVLWHPMKGACYLRDQHGFPEEVWTAVAQHHRTTKTHLSIIDGLFLWIDRILIKPNVIPQPPLLWL